MNYALELENTFALSALMRSTAVVMGLVMAAVAEGNPLGFFLSDWPGCLWIICGCLGGHGAV